MTSTDNRRRTAPHGVLAPGTVLGRFEILNLLSVGGMAEIYLARSEGIAGFEKRVVLKRMLPHFSSQQSYIEMFLAELRGRARVECRSLGEVFDSLDAGYRLAATLHSSGVRLHRRHG